MSMLIHMRDDGGDAPLRYREMTSHHEKKIAELSEEVESLVSGDTEKKYEEWFADERAKYEGYINEAEATRAKYNEMREKVVAWIPPHDYHYLKKFALEQIDMSVDHDCGTKYWEERMPKRQPAADWAKEQLLKLDKDILYYEKELEKNKNTDARVNKWIDELAGSLGIEMESE